jgi:hypothetical protein
LKEGKTTSHSGQSHHFLIIFTRQDHISRDQHALPLSVRNGTTAQQLFDLMSSGLFPDG